jgi:hypothetical protein
LLLIDTFDTGKDEKDKSFLLFGALNVNNSKNVDRLESYFKELKEPLKLREAHLISIMRLQKTVNLAVYEDCFVCLFRNDGN